MFYCSLSSPPPTHISTLVVASRGISLSIFEESVKRTLQKNEERSTTTRKERARGEREGEKEQTKNAHRVERGIKSLIVFDIDELC